MMLTTHTGRRLDAPTLTHCHRNRQNSAESQLELAVALKAVRVDAGFWGNIRNNRSPCSEETNLSDNV